VDVLSFGGTKNGCWCAEALVFFRPELAKQLPFIRKRAAQLFSKTRFIASQFHAYLRDDLWIRLAEHANSMCDRLASGLRRANAIEIAWTHQSNELFVVMDNRLALALQSNGAHFYAWPTPSSLASQISEGHGVYRLVTSFSTDPSDVDQFVTLANKIHVE
ncbi:MAG: low specificity L-threonine aldolase, partial [Planctomycetota bacterium]